MTDTAGIPEISPQELLRTIENENAMQVLDVRAPHSLADGHIELLQEDQFFNIAGSQLMALTDPAEIGLDRGSPIAVVCGHGNASKTVTSFLGERGFQARSVRGGMAAWMMSAYPRDLPTTAELDRLVQFDRVGKGSLTYLVVSEGEALVIDPARNTTLYTDEANKIGVKIVGVIDTHVHADYLSGASALSAELGVPYYLNPADNSHVYEGTPGKLDITPVEDNTTVKVGRASLVAMHTPGHTLGSTTYRLGAEIAFTGDFVFVKSIGRPDLGGEVDKWASLLWTTVVRALAQFPDGIMVYPGHYSSDSERDVNRAVGATFGEIRQTSGPLTIDSEEAFIQWVKERVSNFPEMYKKIKVANVGLLDVTPEEADELEVGKNECAVG